MSEQKPRPTKKYTPIGTRIVVDIVRNPNQTEGGVILPDQSSWITPICKVLAVGPEVKQIKEGDYILVITKVESYLVRHAGEETYVLEESNVYGIIDNPEKYRTEYENVNAG